MLKKVDSMAYDIITPTIYIYTEKKGSSYLFNLRNDIDVLFMFWGYS